MKTFAVIGLGRFGRTIAAELFNMGCEVLAVDKSMELVNLVSDSVTRAVCADAKNEENLRELGIKNYDCVIVSIGNDLTDSVLITLTLKEMGISELVCKARDLQHKKLLEKIGANKVIIPEQEAGIKTAVSLVSNNIMDIINLSDEYSIADIAVLESWKGKTIAELDIRKKYKVNVVAVKDKTGEKITVAPTAEYAFREGDIAVVIGSADGISLLSDI